MTLGITLPSRTAPIPRITDYAAMAEEAGFDSAWTYEVYRNPFTILAGAAEKTSSIALGTGLAAGFSRSPFELANLAADVDELSGGRAVLGMGTGVPEFLASFHSDDFERPVGRMREYLECLYRSWDYFGGDEVEPYAGERYWFSPPPINPWGGRELVRPRIPVLLAAMRPQLLSLVGQKADGWIGYLTTPRFLNERVIPGVERGAIKAGRDIDDLNFVADVICCPHPDREVAIRRAKLHVGFYVSHPVSDVVAELHGVQEQVDEVRMGLMTEGLSALEKTPESLVELFSITGTPEECRQKAEEYRDLKTLVLHTPYTPPFTAEESEDAYLQIIETFRDWKR